MLKRLILLLMILGGTSSIYAMESPMKSLRTEGLKEEWLRDRRREEWLNEPLEEDLSGRLKAWKARKEMLLSKDFEMFLDEFSNKIARVPNGLYRKYHPEWMQEFQRKVGLSFAEKYNKYLMFDLVPKERPLTYLECYEYYKYMRPEAQQEHKAGIQENFKFKRKILDSAVEQILNKARY